MGPLGLEFRCGFVRIADSYNLKWAREVRNIIKIEVRLIMRHPVLGVMKLSGHLFFAISAVTRPFGLVVVRK